MCDETTWICAVAEQVRFTIALQIIFLSYHGRTGRASDECLASSVVEWYGPFGVWFIERFVTIGFTVDDDRNSTPDTQ